MATLHTEGGTTHASMTIGRAPEQHRITDVRVMLGGLCAQRVQRLHVAFAEPEAVGEHELEELSRLQRSCRDREIELHVEGLDPHAVPRLHDSARMPGRPRP